MQKEAVIVFPHQLFEKHPAFSKSRLVIFIEEELFFKQYKFHQQKLIFHRASMKAFEDSLKAAGYSTIYIESTRKEADCRRIGHLLHIQNIEQLHICYLADNWLNRRIIKMASTNGLIIKWYNNPGFLLQPEEANPFFTRKTNYLQTDFYTWHRKKRQLLLDQKQQPLGGKWSFDNDNRERLPKGMSIPSIQPAAFEKSTREAIEYVHQNFKNNPGSISPFIYPTSHAGARSWLQQFLKERLAAFGPYEDAMVKEESYLFHSVLSPLINTGLLTPREVLDETLQYASNQEIPFNSLEGFIRQIIGWREFIHQVYFHAGSTQRTRNFWNFTRPIPKQFYTGETGIDPVDLVIKKLLQTSYNHHIERLMVLGNFFLLCEFHPDAVYQWFMEMYIDSYDWVMVPNTYGMTQFADGGLMTTKPYISGSNYLIKMGNWEKGSWQGIWDGLFWRFMHVHRSFFLQNPRLGMLVHSFDKMPKEKQELHLTNAENFLNQLDQWNQSN
ncbi:cryptochrome/photolyase family protein [Flavihumibacter sp. UBA7668]|uniref:cryptochrome/photolyase family protein n=1 Tax=Flavihumibacter sp. UBA7668 TaxID=1946542 RepID=UPI0025C51EB9|nr:cryptochrome/photolyase family protein [Flavihumibacter sp. UBA7668]